MDCPRCGGSLTEYQLADAETVACDDCIYVGVSVDHTAENTRRESWSEALNRFYQEHSAEQVEEVIAHEGVPVSEDVIPVFEAADASADTEPTDDEAESAAQATDTDSEEPASDTDESSAETQPADTQN